MKTIIRTTLIAFTMLLAAGAAQAHPALGHPGGFTAGFGHPIGGLDHVLAMIAVGILATQLGGRALWSVPAAFLGMMTLGAFLGAAGVGVPFVEPGIIGSVVVLGAVVAVGRRMPASVAAILVGALAVFHGQAHGVEMPASAHGLAYGIGFVCATGLLHAAGIGLGTGAAQLTRRLAPLAVRVAGGMIAAAGVALAAL